MYLHWLKLIIIVPDCKITNYNASQDELKLDHSLANFLQKECTVKDDIFVKLNSNHIIVLKSMDKDVIKYCYDSFGHLGNNKTLQRIKERFFCPMMSKNVKDYCKSCHLCCIHKDTPGSNNAPLVPIDKSCLQVFEMVGMESKFIMINLSLNF